MKLAVWNCDKEAGLTNLTNYRNIIIIIMSDDFNVYRMSPDLLF
jgi:hypothetical protein